MHSTELCTNQRSSLLAPHGIAPVWRWVVRKTIITSWGIDSAMYIILGSQKRTCSVVHFVHPNSCTEGMWMSLCNYKWVCLKHWGFLSSSLWFNCSVTTTWGVQSLRQPSLPHGASNTVQVNKTLADELWLLLMQQFKALLLCQSE